MAAFIAMASWLGGLGQKGLVTPGQAFKLVRPRPVLPRLVLPKQLKKRKDMYVSYGVRSNIEAYKEELNFYYWNVPQERRQQETLHLLTLKQSALEKEVKVLAWRERIFGDSMTERRLQAHVDLLRVKERLARLDLVQPGKDSAGLDLSAFDELFPTPSFAQKSPLRVGLESFLVGLVLPGAMAIGSVVRGELPELDGYFKTVVLSTAAMPVQVFALLKFKGWYGRRYESIETLAASLPELPQGLSGSGTGSGKDPRGDSDGSGEQGKPGAGGDDGAGGATPGGANGADPDK